MTSFAFRIALAALSAALIGPAFGAGGSRHDDSTQTPIKYVIVIIGENRSFDHVFATYVPKTPGATVHNLLSEGIITLDANGDAVPGRNFSKAHQLAAKDLGTLDPFLLTPPKQEFPRDQLPAPLVGGPKVSYFPNKCSGGRPITQCEASRVLAEQTESGLPPSYYQYLLTGGTGQTVGTPDQRIHNVTSLPAGPFQLTGSNFSYDDYAQSPVHRFYQMWQQLDCSVASATLQDPSGCNGQQFAWVEVTVGAGADGSQQPSNFNVEYSPTATTTGEGSSALGFYNVQKGDVPYLTSLARKYAMSDNFHQSVSGGTGPNHIMFGHGDMIWFSDANGRPAAPPNKIQRRQNAPEAEILNEIENPNPAPNTNNWYVEDGYGGGSYSNCSDPAQPGVGAILKYLASLARPINPRCEPGHYYLLNNYNPGYFGNGNNAYLDHNPANTPFTVPPSSTPSMGDDLNAHEVSWRYYGDQWNNYVHDPYRRNQTTVGPKADQYCNICNPFQYDTSLMSHPAQVAAHIQDSVNLYADIANHTLPAVSIVKPSGYTDGHPASSKLDLFEGFVQKIVDQVEASPYAGNTAIFITFDEGGGYYDSGYVQPLDFFGDGTRIPLIVVSPYAKSGYVSHEYGDHVSILKFIERNWSLPPVSHRSRDNFPDPVVAPANPYVPLNSPAIGDLFDLFDFAHPRP